MRTRFAMVVGLGTVCAALLAGEAVAEDAG
jgi:hypothetical protein